LSDGREALLHVAAAIILRPDGQVLLAQRPAGKAYAGYWEFPGGKLEAGETAREALDRELSEELGITVRGAAPWLVQRFRYPHAHVLLHFFRVFEWEGEPVGHDGQAFVWQTPGRFDVSPLLPANTFDAAIETERVMEVLGSDAPASTDTEPADEEIARNAARQDLGQLLDRDDERETRAEYLLRSYGAEGPDQAIRLWSFR